MGGWFFGEGRGLYFEVDADDFVGGPFAAKYGALAELSKLMVSGAAEFDAGGDEDAVDFEARAALELEEQVDESRVGGATSEHPAAGGKDCAGDGFDEAARLLAGDCSHLKCPWDGARGC